MKNKGVSPVLCRGVMTDNFFGCPVCGSKVGGFKITGSGENDWCSHMDNFCSMCGAKIDWRNTSFSEIYKR